MLEKLDKKTYEEKVLGIDGRACVEFFAPWCGYCKLHEAVSERIVNSGNDVPIYLMDGDEYPEIAQEMDVMGYPTYILFENGEKIGELVGANPEQSVRAFLTS